MRLFCFAMQSAPSDTYDSFFIVGARRKIAGRSHWRPGPPAVRSPSRRPRARPLRHCARRDWPVDIDHSRSRLTPVDEKEAIDVLRSELEPQGCSQSIEAEDVQVLVEVAQPG